MDKHHDRHLLCPSAKCEPGALLIGRVKKDNSVVFALEPREVTEVFVDQAAKGRKAEERFRFANSCVKGGCLQWKNGNCSIVDTTIQILNNYVKNEYIQDCPIRSECRWHFQSGNKACRICSFVTTERTIQE